jgi:Arc/MetJ-type ribon-helix-helix transcriptional regulator
MRSTSATRITLKPETQRRVQDRLETGQYSSADEVVEAALNALDELQSPVLNDQALDAIDRAEDQIESGQVRDWNDVREDFRSRFLGK